MRYYLILVLFSVFTLNCADTTVFGDCNSTPSHNASLTASTPVSVSHRYGEDCMQAGCHDGTAQTKWTIAGSVEDPKGSKTPAIAGETVTYITSGALALNIDTCGNFYTSADIATPGYTFLPSSPKTKNSAVGMMTGSWGGVESAALGSCNQSACHSSSAWGLIY